MTWEQFVYFAVASVLLWIVGAWAAWKRQTVLAYTTTVAGLALFLLLLAVFRENNISSIAYYSRHQ